jgi:hypothetical protein
VIWVGESADRTAFGRTGDGLKREDGREDGNLIVGEGIHLEKGKSLAIEAPGVCWKIRLEDRTEFGS